MVGMLELAATLDRRLLQLSQSSGPKCKLVIVCEVEAVVSLHHSPNPNP